MEGGDLDCLCDKSEENVVAIERSGVEIGQSKVSMTTNK
jgi:hypothetical protein